jgi:hypothetical protein
MFVCRGVRAPVFLLSAVSCGQVASQNINMVSAGENWPADDPYLQRQIKPSGAVSSGNPEPVPARSNEYRTFDIPNLQAPISRADARLSVYTSMDGGETLKSTLLPGYPLDTSPKRVPLQLASQEVRSPDKFRKLELTDIPHPLASGMNWSVCALSFGLRSFCMRKI